MTALSRATILLGVTLAPAFAWASEPATAGATDGGLTARELGFAPAPGGPPGVIHGIINGEAARVDDYPAAGGLLLNARLEVPGYGVFPYVSFLCSSTLIAPDVVMLAAHCVDELALTGGQGTITEMEFGWSREADLSGFGPRVADWPEDNIMVRAWAKHEDFNLYRLRLGLADNHDIALIFLEEPLLDVAPALLPTADEGATLSEGDRVIAVGWGQQTATSGSQAPPRGTFAIKMMGESPISELGPEEMKVGEEREDVRKCHGDSGGPSFFFLPEGETETDDLMRVVGVTSHAYDSSDCSRTGGVDTRVDHHLDWIDATMRAACDDGTRVWCDEPGILPTTYNDEPEVEDTDAVAEGTSEDERKGGLGCASVSGRGWAVAGLIGGLGLALSRRRRR